MVTLSSLFSDGCVLRAGAGARVFGTALPREHIFVRFQGAVYGVSAGADGGFSVTLKDLLPGTGFELEVNGVLISDVAVGEVWVASGQSNMQITFDRIGRAYPEVIAAPNPLVRQYSVQQETCFTGPQSESHGVWAGATPENISSFSAVGYFFASARAAKTGMPVGIIAAAIGGTPIQCWLPEAPAAEYPEPSPAPEFLPAIPVDFNFAGSPCDPEVTQSGGGIILWRKRVGIPPEFRGQSAELALGTIVDSDETYVDGQFVGATGYRYPPRYYKTPQLGESAEIIVKQTFFNWGKFTEQKQRALRFEGGSVPITGDWERRRILYFPDPLSFPNPDNAPCGYFNAMIAPLTKFPISGVIWYQGESDDKTPEGYEMRFAQLVWQWRELWNNQFPFLTVMLARFDETDWTAVREKQKKCGELPGVYVFDAWDYGEPNDLHPLQKKPVGEGLAALPGDK